MYGVRHLCKKLITFPFLSAEATFRGRTVNKQNVRICETGISSRCIGTHHKELQDRSFLLF